MSHTLCDFTLEILPTYFATSNPISRTKPAEEDLGKSSDSDRSNDELDYLQQLEEFIKALRAISILRETLRAFVESSEAPTTNHIIEGRLAAKEVHIIDPSEPVESKPLISLKGASPSTSPTVGDWLRVQSPLLVSTLQTLAMSIGIRRPNVEAGKIRIDWQCASLSNDIIPNLYSFKKHRNVDIKVLTTSSS